MLNAAMIRFIRNSHSSTMAIGLVSDCPMATQRPKNAGREDAGW